MLQKSSYLAINQSHYSERKNERRNVNQFLREEREWWGRMSSTIILVSAMLAWHDTKEMKNCYVFYYYENLIISSTVSFYIFITFQNIISSFFSSSRSDLFLMLLIFILFTCYSSSFVSFYHDMRDMHMKWFFFWMILFLDKNVN